MLSEEEVKILLRNYFFNKYQVNVKVDIQPVIIDDHYEFLGDAIIRLSSTSDVFELSDFDVINIFNECYSNQNYYAFDSKSMITMQNGKLKFKGIEFKLNEKVNMRSI